MRVVAIGRLRSGPEAALFARYAARLRPALGLTELAEGAGAPAEAKRREGAALLGALPDTAFAVALDLGAAAPSSERLAALLERWLGLSRPVCFLIGGADGLDAAGERLAQVLAGDDHPGSLASQANPTRRNPSRS